MKALLLGSLQAMKDTYNVVPPGKKSTDWKAELEQLKTTFPVGLTRWEPSYAPDDDNLPIRSRRMIGGR